MALIAVAVGIFLLIKGGDWLMRASVALSLRFSIPKIVIGMTVVSFATSAPELIVSVRSALTGHPDLAIVNENSTCKGADKLSAMLLTVTLSRGLPN